MLRKGLALIAVLGVLLCLPDWWGVFATESSSVISAEVSARAAIVMDAQSGRIYYQKNADEVLPMASTTKMMAALVALESGMGLDEYFTVDANAIMVEGSSMGLQKGDQVTLRALCYGMLLESGNDAANAAAVRVAGSIPEFCELMNRRAESLELTDTHFMTPSGLDADGHHTTALELAKIAREALQNEDFAEICASASATVSFGNPPYERRMYNHNKLLRQYEGTIGIKTGFTKKSGRCLVSAAERNGVRLICVTLNAPSDWNDHKRLYDAAFGALTDCELTGGTGMEPIPEQIPVIGGAAESVAVTEYPNPHAALLEGEYSRVRRAITIAPSVSAPVQVGDRIGEVVYLLDDIELARTGLFTAEAVEQAADERSGWQKFCDWIAGLFGGSDR